jgi:hypothetical protein
VADETLLRYLMPNAGPGALRQPASLDEAKNILDRHPETSCLVLRQDSGRTVFEELLCANRTCIDRSRDVFASIQATVRKHRIPVGGQRFIFHFKGDACELRPDFPLLANSRNVGNEQVILWPLLFKKRYLLSFARYSPYLHDEITCYRHKPDDVPWEKKAPIFFFRGRNSGNPFCSIQYPWNGFRSSRQQLLVEALRLPADLRPLIDIGFNELYPKRKILVRKHGDRAFLEGGLGRYLKGGCTIADLEGDIALALSHIKPSLGAPHIYRYRYHFCPEGFDCSSSLSWVLASNSLAIVPPFHYENVIINSQTLKPYVHFLPIKEDYSDLADVMRWAVSHDDECRQMVANANAYMRPFVDPACMEEAQRIMISRLVN